MYLALSDREAHQSTIELELELLVESKFRLPSMTQAIIANFQK